MKWSDEVLDTIKEILMSRMHALLTAAIMLSITAVLADGLTLEQYFAEKREYNKRIGREFDQEKYTKLFAQLDQNNDGLLTPDERNPPARTTKASYPQPRSTFSMPALLSLCRTKRRAPGC